MSAKKVLRKALGAGALIYGALFTVFFLDLDGKAIFYGLEPVLDKYYANMERRDVAGVPYELK